VNPQASQKIKSLIINILKSKKFNSLNKSTKNFVNHVLILFLSIKGRINFLQMERYGYLNELSYRNNFKKKINFFEFNKNLVATICTNALIGFDPSYLLKSGKTTYGVGYFWSGVAGKAKWGNEISGFAIIAPELNTAFHLNAIQTPPANELEEKNKTLLEHYGSLIVDHAVELKKISDYIVADAYFSKASFVKAVAKAKMFLVSRLRDDSNLNYIYNGPMTGKKGVPKKFDGKINFKNINLNHFKLEYQDQEMEVYGTIAYSVAFKRNINVAFVKYLKDGQVKATKIYFSTNLKQETYQIVTHYRSRFQMEFIFRDAKQFTGVNTCEARSQAKINFHTNVALTCVNLAKVDWFSNKINHKLPFSMSDYKTQFNNELMINRFIRMFGINPNLPKNKKIINELMDYGKIAA
jgi:hypothetical protein